MRHHTNRFDTSGQQPDSSRQHHPDHRRGSDADPIGLGWTAGPGPWTSFGGPRGRGRGRGPGHHRAARGQIRAAVLLLLAERPRHGYDLITELTDRSEGRWNPSPGSIYPMLRRLADHGLVASEEADGKRVFNLTDEGRAYVDAHREQWGEPWKIPFDAGQQRHDALRSLVGQVMVAAQQVDGAGTDDQRHRAEEILQRTRRDLYSLLAE